jgi:uncharacterized protein (TIGR03435 family)
MRTRTSLFGLWGKRSCRLRAAVPFADAIQKQLGLKLEVHKRPQPVLVIDHMEEFPTEN